MKRIVLLSTILVLLIGVAMLACGDDTVTFPDLNLEMAIRETINKPKDPIYMSDLKPLTMLEVQERSILDLTGLEHLTNLQWLTLVENDVSDISPLTSLTNLQGLLLLGNDISDLSPLAGLTNLETLNLRGNNISDISPLAANSGLAEGDTVDLRDNPLSTISVNTYIHQLEERGVDVEY